MPHLGIHQERRDIVNDEALLPSSHVVVVVSEG
jgi:hypothetical protein